MYVFNDSFTRRGCHNRWVTYKVLDLRSQKKKKKLNLVMTQVSSMFSVMSRYEMHHVHISFLASFCIRSFGSFVALARFECPPRIKLKK